tara:strand:+ start:121 stop:3273 length:3153 start_codon:yes stop_codon:yes gene_type:complete
MFSIINKEMEIFNFNLEHTISPFNLEEKYDIDKLDIILDNWEDFKDIVGFAKDSKGKVLNSEGTFTIFKKMSNIYKKQEYNPNTTKKHYNFVNGSTYGRMFRPYSLQGCKKTVRHTICKEFYIDIDIVNAHPVFFKFLCEFLSINNDSMDYYVCNREKCIEELLLIFPNKTRGDIKEKMLAIMNGSQIGFFSTKETPSWLCDYVEDMKKILKEISEHFPSILQEITDKHKNAKFANIHGKTVNKLLCHFENTVLHCMKQFVERKGKKIGTNCFDGILLYKEGFKSDNSINKFMIAMEKDVFNRTKIPIKLSIKEMTEDIDLTGYKRNKTLQELLDIKQKLRTREEQEEIDLILKNITSKNINCLTETTLLKSIEHAEKYVDYNILKDNKKINIIKAGLGKGKSTSTGQFIKESDYDIIVVLTPRRSYARSARDRLEIDTGLKFVCYLDKTTALLKDPYVVIQAESLHRLDLNLGKTLIIIDESEAFLSQLTSTITHKENHIKNVETFIELIKNADKVIALDAFISDRTLKTFITLSGKNHISFHEYTQKLEERKATEIDCIDGFIKSLMSDLELGKKIFLFSSSNTKLLTTKKKVYIDKEKEDKILYALLPAIRDKFKNKNIIEFHSKYVSLQLKNVNEQWKDADLVACTSTITVGCNFDLPNVFHKVYMYVSASSQNLVRDMFQASWRVRHLIDNEMVYCLDSRHYGKNYSTSKYDISKSLDDKHNSIINIFNVHKVKNPIDTPPFIKFLAVFNEHERNVSVMNLRELFDKYLELCNYKKVFNDLDFDDFELDSFIEPTTEYKDIKEITNSVCKTLMMKKKNIPLTEEESLQVEKFQFQFYLLNRPFEIEEGLWKIYTNFGKGKFRNLSIEKGIQQGTITIKDIIDKESYSHMNNGSSLRMDVINKIINWIGMTNTQDFGYVVSKDKINSIIKHFEDNRQDIHIAFDMRDRTKGEYDSKTVLVLINKILERWGYSTLKSDKTKKRIDGKVVDISKYTITQSNSNDIDVGLYIKPAERFINDKVHPLLLSKDHKNIISDSELEDIRLNRQ